MLLITTLTLTIIHCQEDQAVLEHPKEEPLSTNLITILKPHLARSQAYPNKERRGLPINR